MVKWQFILTKFGIWALCRAEQQTTDVRQLRHLQGFRLYNTGRPVDEIINLLNCGKRTLYGWVRRYQQSWRGRLRPQWRIGLYGALEVEPGQEFALSPTGMSGANTVHFLQHILACIPDRPLLILWNRASRYKGEARRFVEAHPRLAMVYFPPASPDLNPQEYIWKLTQHAVGHLHDSTHISQGRQAVQVYLGQTLFHVQ